MITYDSITCPNPSRYGCGCPVYSNRCYGYISWVREEFKSNLAMPGPTQGDRQAAAEATLKSLPEGTDWSVAEILRRF